MFNCEHYEIGTHFCFMAGKLNNYMEGSGSATIK